MVTGFAMKTTAPIALEGLSQAGRGLAMQAAVRQAADDLAARFPESEGFRHKIVEFPTWAEKKVFGAEICFRRGVAAGFNVTVSVSTKDREKAAINVMRSARFEWLVEIPATAMGIVAIFWLTAGVEFHHSGVGLVLLVAGAMGGAIAGFPVLLLLELLLRTAGMATSNAELNDALTIVEQAISKTVGICPG